jgi:hypothetical protein
MPGVHHEPNEKTRKFVREAAVYGMNQEEIAGRLSICVDTLVKHYDYELYHYKYDVNMEVENIALKKVRKGDWRAIETWLKCKNKWAAAKPKEDSATDALAKSLIEKLQGLIGQNDK